MKPNPFLKKLGFSDNDRAVIIHTDDIGMWPGIRAGVQGIMGVGDNLIRCDDGPVPVVSCCGTDVP